MYVSKIDLKDFRSFEHASIELSKNINIFTGHNNSGKSSIIKAVYSIQNLHTLLTEDIRIQKSSAEINIDLEGIDLISNEKYFGVTNPFSTKLTQCTVAAKVLKKEIERKLKFLDPNGPSKVEFTDDGTPHWNIIHSNFSGFSASEIENNFIYPFFSKRKLNRYSSQSSKSDAFSVLDNFQNLPAKVQKTASQPVTKERYEKLCREILGFSINVIPSEVNENRLGIYSGYNNTIPLESMGEGVANIIGLITILLTEDRKLFLLEEIENDIHPSALKKLLALIIEKAEYNQFIISTHSNIVLKYLGSLATSKIFCSEYNPGVDEEVNVPTSTIVEVPNEIAERLRLLEHLGYDLFDYDIYNGYLVFEESSAERLIREFIIPIFFPEYKSKIRTIAAKGVNDLEPKFNDLHRLFMYLHTNKIYQGKAWAIADGDKPGIDVISKMRNTFKTWDKEHFINFSKFNFEEYYPLAFQEDINRVISLKPSEEKRRQKKQLLDSVIKWLIADMESAKAALEESAGEVIDKIGKVIESFTKNRHN